MAESPPLCISSLYLRSCQVFPLPRLQALMYFLSYLRSFRVFPLCIHAAVLTHTIVIVQRFVYVFPASTAIRSACWENSSTIPSRDGSELHGSTQT